MSGNDIFTMILAAVDWFTFSIGLHLVLEKLGEKKCWQAWVPGLRFFKLGQALGMSFEGVLCGLLELLLYPVCFIQSSISHDVLCIYFWLQNHCRW